MRWVQVGNDGLLTRAVVRQYSPVQQVAFRAAAVVTQSGQSSLIASSSFFFFVLSFLDQFLSFSFSQLGSRLWLAGVGTRPAGCILSHDRRGELYVGTRPSARWSSGVASGLRRRSRHPVSPPPTTISPHVLRPGETGVALARLHHTSLPPTFHPASPSSNKDNIDVGGLTSALIAVHPWRRSVLSSPLDQLGSSTSTIATQLQLYHYCYSYSYTSSG